MANLELIRFAYSPDGTFGFIDLPGGGRVYTCEPPWKGNQRRVSCIPEGVYDLRKRRSPVVERTSGGDFTEGWEVTDVPERTFIMIHVGNWPDDLEGCIAPGKRYQVLNGKNAVVESRSTFRALMKALEGPDHHTLDIKPYRPEYP